MLKIAKNPDKARRGKTRQDKTRRGGPQKRRCPLVLKNDIDRKFIRVHCWVSIDVQVSRFDMQWEVSYSEPASLHQCSWWRHQIQTFSALLAICAGNSPVPGEFPAQRPVARSFDVFFDLRLNKPLSKQWCDWSFETLSCQLWRHCNVFAGCRPTHICTCAGRDVYTNEQKGR